MPKYVPKDKPPKPSKRYYPDMLETAAGLSPFVVRDRQNKDTVVARLSNASSAASRARKLNRTVNGQKS